MRTCAAGATSAAEESILSLAAAAAAARAQPLPDNFVSGGA